MARALRLGLLFAALVLSACTSPPPTQPGRGGLSRVDHVVVIYAENRSFDHLYGLFPGADGIANATPAQDPTAKRAIIYNRGPESPDFQAHHQPFNYFARFAPGTADRAQHLRDGDDFVAAIDSGRLPQVAFYKPPGRFTQHPSYTDLTSGDAHIAELLEHLRQSPQWRSMAVIVTYDENGGFWDHVPPPTGDRRGPGTRIAIIISPFAKRGYVDHTSYDTASIIKFITRRFDLEPLPGVRAGAGDLTAAFDFGG